MSINEATILVVEENAPTRIFLTDNLTADGYVVLAAEERGHALALLSSHRPALVLADLSGETLRLLDAVRTGEGLASEVDPDTPMIVLSSQADELTRLRAFERGSDDVVAKPFSYPELRARIRAVLRRTSERRRPFARRVGNLVLDHRTREVRLGGRLVALAEKEYQLLRVLTSDPTRVFTKQELLREVWGIRVAGLRTRTLDSHASRLRKKLMAAGGERAFVINVWGVGFRLIDEMPASEAA